MNRFVRTNVLLWAAVMIAIATSCVIRAQDNSGHAPPTDGENEDRVLVLQDGGVLVGRITREGERYLVKRGGAEVQIPPARVMLVATSLEAAYQQRRQQLARPTADAHLALAEWCLRYDLLDQAERELADARRLDARHGGLAVMERRLAMAIERRDTQAAIQPASKSQSPVVDQPAHVPSAIGDLPAGVVERFTRRVQPILVNNCTTSGCHQPGGAEKFQLDRALLRGLSNRRSTMHNLTATLELVDRRQPQLSPLLTVPRRTHGGTKGPIFGPRQEPAFRHLVDWVALVTQTQSLQHVTPAAAADADVVTAGGRLPSRWTSPVMRVGKRADERVAKSSTTGKGKPVAWLPRDPFDPEIVTRQNASQPNAAGPTETTTPEENR